MSKFYCGTDVHSYTLDLRSRSNEFSEFWKKPMNRESVTALIAQLKTSKWLSLGGKSMLMKLEENRNLFDPELGIYVAPLLFDCFRSLQTFPESELLFFSILDEINSTCVQGDTHRLLSYYFSVQE